MDGDCRDTADCEDADVAGEAVVIKVFLTVRMMPLMIYISVMIGFDTECEQIPLVAKMLGG